MSKGILKRIGSGVVAAAGGTVIFIAAMLAPANYDDAGSDIKRPMPDLLPLERITNDVNSLSADEIAESRRRILEGKATAQDKLFEVSVQNITKPRGEAERAATYSEGWASGSLNETLARFAPNARGVIDGTKTKYLNGATGIEIVYDNDGDYFRIFDTKLTGRRAYLDLDGTIPNNKLENGKQKGRTQSEYNQVTHFKNTDK